MSADRDTLVKLLERVRRATEYDAELEAALWLAVVPGASRKNLMALWPDDAPIWEYHDPERNTSARFIPRIMQSIDVALALTERVLPGWTVAQLGQQDDKSWWCELREGYLTSYSRVARSETSIDKRPANLPLAIVAALLSALIAQPQPTGMDQ